VLERAADHRRGQGRVDDKQRPRVVRDVGELGHVGHRGGRVRDRLRVDDPGGRPDGRLHLVQVGDVDEVRLHAEAGRHVAQEPVRAAVNGGGRHHVRAGPREGPEHSADRGHPRGERLGRGPARQVHPFQRGDRAGERVDGGVVDPAVGVAGHLVVQHGPVLLGRAERERRRAVHRRAKRFLRRRRRGREVHRTRVLAGLLTHYVHDVIPQDLGIRAGPLCGPANQGRTTLGSLTNQGRTNQGRTTLGSLTNQGRTNQGRTTRVWLTVTLASTRPA
jgi:hypothetical protein